jgi:uncharacterized protein YndB with AHSA1/START domain
MNSPTAADAFGTLSESATLTVKRRLPGPIERVWAYLTDSDLRRQWLAAGTMEMKVGTPFELVWRNDELTQPPGMRPSGFTDEHRMACRVVEFEPFRKLTFTWNGTGDVTFELEAQGKEVLLTVTHRRISERNMRLMVGAGWHMHLDILVARIGATEPEPFWDGWSRLRTEYDRRMPA